MKQLICSVIIYQQVFFRSVLNIPKSKYNTMEWCSANIFVTH